MERTAVSSWFWRAEYLSSWLDLLNTSSSWRRSTSDSFKASLRWIAWVSDSYLHVSVKYQQIELLLEELLDLVTKRLLAHLPVILLTSPHYLSSFPCRCCIHHILLKLFVQERKSRLFLLIRGSMKREIGTFASAWNFSAKDLRRLEVSARAEVWCSTTSRRASLSSLRPLTSSSRSVKASCISSWANSETGHQKRWKNRIHFPQSLPPSQK